MLRYFWEILKPSILTKLKHRDLKLENFNQMIKKAINAKAKVAFQPHSNIRIIDQHYPHSNWLTNSTIAKSQGSVIKELWVKKPKV